MYTTPNIGLKVWNNSNDEFDPQDLQDNWDAIDSQFSSTSVDVVPTRFIESGTTLPVTSLSDGRFFYLTAANGGFPSKTLVRYDGSAWRAVGPTEVNSTLPGSNLYGGRTVYLTAASGGFAANSFVAYNSNTSSWEEVGGIESSATVPASNLYAGRAVVLTAANGGFDAYSLLVYNGSAWVRTEKRGIEVGSALPGSPYTGQVYVLTGATGNFAAGDVVRWDGSNWGKVGPGAITVTLAQFSALTPTNGQLVYLEVDATNGIYWQLRYRSASASTSKWEFVGGPPLTAEVLTAEGTASTTYAALATAGPSVALPVAGDYMVALGHRSPTNANVGWMSYDIGGSAAVDGDGVESSGDTAGHFQRSRRKTGFSAVTLTAKYRAPAGALHTFSDRFISVTPIRLG